MKTYARNFNLLDLSLKKKVFGQDEAIDSLVDYISISMAGLNDKDKPIGSFLFTGPTGVGKTELAKQLSIELDMHFIRLDMSEYSTDYSSDNLIGGAAGLVGYSEGGILTNAVMENPKSVLLFDEIEKAHKKVLHKFLQILDYGKLTSSKGEKVDFCETIIIFTSNLNAVSTTKRTAGFNSSSYIEYENSMDEFLSPEFKARINQIIHFNALDDATLRLIITKTFCKINQMLEAKNINAQPSQSFIDKTLELTNRNLGARNVENFITKYVKSVIATGILHGDIKNGSEIFFHWDEKSEKGIYTIGPQAKEEKNTLHFDTAFEAQCYAKENIGACIKRNPSGKGYVVK